ncbi:hypothetical protein R1flu_026225 [Riccia fluitans]|uniref:PGG domain-containing protein n=1 Tax=Riccia fluitans TaxID=41844 RepID=A0ABD1XFD5_9MARC
MQGAGRDDPPSRFEILKEQLLQVVEENGPTRQIVTDYPLSKIPHDEYIYTELQLNILHIVAMAGDLDSVKELRSQGRADPRAKTVGGFSAVHLAASRGHTEAVKELVSWLTLQSNTEAGVSDHGFTPLHLATYKGHSETVEFLLADHHFSNANAQDEIFGRTALHFAVLAGHATIVEMLMSVRGVNVRLIDRVRKLTPLLLAAMHPRDEDGSRLRMVKMFLDKNAEQINDKVGVFTDVRGLFTESLQKLTLIKCDHDNSVKPVPEIDVQADESEVDAYRRHAVPMDGHTALHLAATQNNAELVSELSSRPGVSLNTRDTRFGMTPLHCAIRVGAVQTFETLMAIDGVNVNAQLEKEGGCEKPIWLPQASSFHTRDLYRDKMFKFFTNFARLETPLHLAVHVCRAEVLTDMVLYFCNHPNFNGAVYNGDRRTSLELVWERVGYCGKIPLFFKSRRERTGSDEVQVENKYVYEDENHLSNAIELLKRHPTNAAVLAEKERIGKALKKSVNTFLVSVTLMAGLTFNAYLHPPIGTDDVVDTRIVVKLFWIFNGLSFFLAVFTILTCLFHSIRDQSNGIKYSHPDSWDLYVAIAREQGAVPLSLSVGCGIMAFVASGYANVPSDSKLLLIVCTGGGLLLSIYPLIRNILYNYIQFRGPAQSRLFMSEVSLTYNLSPTRLALHLVLRTVFGGDIFFAVTRFTEFFEYQFQGQKIKTQVCMEIEDLAIWNPLGLLTLIARF